MEVKDLALISAIISAVLWAAKKIGDKLIDNYFESKKRVEELRDSMLDDRLNWLTKAVDDLKKTIVKNTDEIVRHKITMQALSKDLNQLRVDLKDTTGHQKETIIRLIEVLKSMQNDIRIQKQEIETIGRVIMRLPEER